jgi:UDP-N-acetyl-D-galactosamine dehydrogenase
MTAARQLNDGMGSYVAEKVINLMNKKGILIKGANILILGFSFKENCPDIRNTKVIDIYHTFSEYGTFIDIIDPIAEKNSSILILKEIPVNKKYDAIILAVPHEEFLKINVKNLRKELCVVADIKGVWEKTDVDFRL